MSTLDEKQIDGLKKLLNLLEPNALTTDQFVKSFKTVIAQIAKAEKILIAKIDAKTDGKLNELKQLREQHKQVIAKIEKENTAGLSNLKKWAIKKVEELFVKSRIEEKIAEIDVKLAGVKDGKNADEKEIVKQVLSQIPPADEETPEQLRDKLEKLSGEERIDVSGVKGLGDLLEEFKKTIPKHTPFGGSVVHKFIDDETPVGVINGTNKVFTLVKSPIGLKLYQDGQRMKLAEDYTLANKTITFVNAPLTDTILLVDYRYF